MSNATKNPGTAPPSGRLHCGPSGHPGEEQGKKKKKERRHFPQFGLSVKIPVFLVALSRRPGPQHELNVGFDPFVTIQSVVLSCSDVSVKIGKEEKKKKKEQIYVFIFLQTDRTPESLSHEVFFYS